ncbi:MAG: tetratricopeptide repeat protein [Deltaproteobacteria bacterium]|nr:tetratricopeptide repeat protein [Deltaproteobacteria bacterium]
MSPEQLHSFAEATLAHALIQLAVHFPEELGAVPLTVPEALERALGLAEAAIARSPELADGYVALGRLLLCHDEDDALADAVEILEHAVALDPEHDGAELALATALHARGHAQDALGRVERVLKRGNGQAQGLVLRASILADLGRHEDATRDMERAVRIAPYAGMVHLDAARIFAAAGDAEASAVFAAQARALLGAAYAAVDKALARP